MAALVFQPPAYAAFSQCALQAPVLLLGQMRQFVQQRWVE
jgi:hypothetical protein